METTQTKSQATDDAASSDSAFQSRCLVFLLSLPWRQAGLHFEFPASDGDVKSICKFLNAPIDDRGLESFQAKHPVGSDGWQPSDLVALACHLNIRIQAPGGDQ